MIGVIIVSFIDMFTTIKEVNVSKNILFVNVSKYKGGAEISLIDLIRNIDRSKFNCFLALPPNNNYQDELMHIATVESVPMINLRRSLHLWSILKISMAWWESVRIMLQLIRKHRINVVYANSTKANVYTWILRIFSNCKIVWHMRDRLESNFVGWWLGLFSHKIICNSDFTRNQLHFFCYKSSVIYNLVSPLHDNLSDLPFAGNWNEETIKLVQVGQLVSWKNHADSICALKVCLAHTSHVHLFIIGGVATDHESPYKKGIDQLIDQQGLSSYISFIQFTDPIDGYLQSMDILVHPAFGEPFGRVVIEAMRAGKPVVAYDEGGPAEFLQDGVTGCLVKRSDGYKGLAEKIVFLVNDRQRASIIGKNATIYVERHFDRLHLLGMYEKLLSGL